MFLSPLVTELVEALRVLPGVGPKSAQRMALFLLERNREGGRRLAEVLSRAMDNVRECRQCQTLSDTELCRICSGAGRDHSLLCVVENPVDQIAIESSGSFRGLYFVLKGHLSPLDGIGPRELGIPALLARVRWIPDSSGLFVQRLNRVQNCLDLLHAGAATGASLFVIDTA